MKTPNNNLLNMEKESKFGLMALCTMETGEMEWRKVKAISTTLTVTYTKENSIKIGPMDLVCMSIKMDRLMKDFGKMTCKMVPERKSLKMDLSTMECLRMVKSGGKAPINGLTNQFIPETGLTTTSKEKVSTNGLMAEFTTASGKRINFMVRESILGRTAEDMKENTKMIKNTEWAHTTGPMAKLTKDSGLMESNTEKQDSLILRDEASWASGKMESVLNG